MNGFSVSSFIDDILLPQTGAMLRDAQYLAFGQIAVGIEFLGACADNHDFGKRGESASRFGLGIDRYMAKVDSRYSTYNQNASPYYLYKYLRCGMAHVARPQGSIGFIAKGQADKAKIKHLDQTPSGDAIVMVLEPFFEDFTKACGHLKADLPNLNQAKLAQTFLPLRTI